MEINPSCTVCKHIDRLKIEEALKAGEAFRSVSRKSGLSRSALGRHIKQHTDIRVLVTKNSPESLVSVLNTGPKATIAEKEIVASGGISNIAGQVGNLYVKAVKLMNRAERAGNFAASVSANRQALSCLEVYFKSSEALYAIKKREEAEESLTTIRGAILDALADFPEAKIAVAQALEASA
jgi:hypothetical protein